MPDCAKVGAVELRFLPERAPAIIAAFPDAAGRLCNSRMLTVYAAALQHTGRPEEAEAFYVTAREELSDLPAELADLEYRRVEVNGEFDYDLMDAHPDASRPFFEQLFPFVAASIDNDIGPGNSWRLQEFSRLGSCRQKRLDLSTRLGVISAGVLHEGRPLVRVIEPGCCSEDLLDALKIHGLVEC